MKGILGDRQPVIRLRGGAPLLHGFGSEAVLTHQPRDAMLANAMALLDQRVPDAGTAIGVPRLLVDHSNGRESGPPLDGPGSLAYSAESGRRFRANPATPRSPATQGLSCLSEVADFRPIWPTVCASILL